MVSLPVAASPTTKNPAASQLFHNKYKWPEFAGHLGEQHLLDVLVDILPRKVKDTVAEFVKKQPPSGKCFLGNVKVARRRRVSVRTIERDLQYLRERGLVLFGAGWEVVKEGQPPRYVTIKDFTGLWDLAHQYSVWHNFGSTPIPCDSGEDCENIALITSNETILNFLLQFDNYRSLLNRYAKDADFDYVIEETHDLQSATVLAGEPSLYRINNIFNFRFDSDSNLHILKNSSEDVSSLRSAQGPTTRSKRDASHTPTSQTSHSQPVLHETPVAHDYTSVDQRFYTPSSEPTPTTPCAPSYSLPEIETSPQVEALPAKQASDEIPAESAPQADPSPITPPACEVVQPQPQPTEQAPVGVGDIPRNLGYMRYTPTPRNATERRVANRQAAGLTRGGGNISIKTFGQVAQEMAQATSQGRAAGFVARESDTLVIGRIRTDEERLGRKLPVSSLEPAFEAPDEYVDSDPIDPEYPEDDAEPAPAVNVRNAAPAPAPTPEPVVPPVVDAIVEPETSVHVDPVVVVESDGLVNGAPTPAVSANDGPIVVESTQKEAAFEKAGKRDFLASRDARKRRVRSPQTSPAIEEYMRNLHAPNGLVNRAPTNGPQAIGDIVGSSGSGGEVNREQVAAIFASPQDTPTLVHGHILTDEQRRNRAGGALDGAPAPVQQSTPTRPMPQPDGLINRAPTPAPSSAPVPPVPAAESPYASSITGRIRSESEREALRGGAANTQKPTNQPYSRTTKTDRNGRKSTVVVTTPVVSCNGITEEMILGVFSRRDTVKKGNHLSWEIQQPLAHCLAKLHDQSPSSSYTLFANLYKRALGIKPELTCAQFADYLVAMGEDIYGGSVEAKFLNDQRRPIALYNHACTANLEKFLAGNTYLPSQVRAENAERAARLASLGTVPVVPVVPVQHESSATENALECPAPIYTTEDTSTLLTTSPVTSGAIIGDVEGAIVGVGYDDGSSSQVASNQAEKLNEEQVGATFTSPQEEEEQVGATFTSPQEEEEMKKRRFAVHDDGVTSLATAQRVIQNNITDVGEDTMIVEQENDNPLAVRHVTQRNRMRKTPELKRSSEFHTVHKAFRERVGESMYVVPSARQCPECGNQIMIVSGENASCVMCHPPYSWHEGLYTEISQAIAAIPSLAQFAAAASGSVGDQN